MVKEEECK